MCETQVLSAVPLYVPLCDDYTALPALEATPHAPTALLEILRSRVDGVKSRGLCLAPVWN